MCTSIVHNGTKTIVGWNLDILDMDYRVEATDHGVYIEIFDKTEGWMPLFGANARGDFVAMPTCWPYDKRSDPEDEHSVNIIKLNMNLLLCNSTFEEIKELVKNSVISSVLGVTFQSQLSDKEGNVLQIIPGQGYKFYEKPKYSIMTNFSLFKGDKEKHLWMGLDRYDTAKRMLENAQTDFDVKDCFEILKATAQTVCPTVVSMVVDVTNNAVFWCKNREWNQISVQNMHQQQPYSR